MAANLNFSDPRLLQYPAGDPPPGVTPNFTNPHSRGLELVIPGGVLLAIMLMSIVMRSITKLHIVHKFSWDDLAIFFSALGAILLYGVCVWAIVDGPVGKHTYETRLWESFNMENIIPGYIIEVILSPVLWATKSSFFLLYLQIFRPWRWLRLSIYIGATLTTVIYWSVWVVSTVILTPKRGQSLVEASLASGPRQLSTKLGILIAWVGLAVDVFLLILPSIAVYQLQLSNARKIGMILIFSTGLVAVIVSALSIYYRSVLLHTPDVDWVLIDVELMFLIEIFIGIITNSMPSCARMFRHYLPPWTTLQSQLSRWTYSIRPGSEKSRLHSQRGTKNPHSNPDRNTSGYEEEDQYGILDRAVAHGSEYDSTPQIGMDRLRVVDTYIKAGSPAPVEKDGIHLKHDLHQTWSSKNCETAETPGGSV